MNTLILIPSARLIPPELQSEFGVIPSGMIPIDARPVIHHILDKYEPLGYRSVVLVGEAAEDIIDYVSLHPDLNAEIHNVGHTDSLGRTILAGLMKAPQDVEQVVINYADTHVADPIKGGNVICMAKPVDHYRWTAFQIDDQGQIVHLIDKEQPKDIDTSWMVFIGVFAIGNIKAFIRDLQEKVNSPDDTDVDPFYQAIHQYFNRIPKHEKEFLHIKNWNDLGHLDTYYASRRRFSMNARFFNEIHVDEQRGIIRKSSKNVEKLLNEINWYLHLPNELQHIAPRIFDYSLNSSQPFVEMEFYGYPLLSDVYLYSNWDVGTWARTLHAIEQTLDEFARYVCVPAKQDDSIIDALREMCELKTLDRLDQTIGLEHLEKFRCDHININGRRCMGLKQVEANLREVIETSGLYENVQFTVIHGDLCLSNILYDRRNGIIRLIDPRGRFGRFDIYGDQRYDLAKLCHSFEGDYDFFVNDLFDLAWNNNTLSYGPRLRPAHIKIKKLFRRNIIRRCAGSYPQVKLIESLLFFSMIPLHMDRPRSQQAFLAKGLEIFTSLVEGHFDRLVNK